MEGNRGPAVTLNDELFGMVEEAQGFAYVSDGVKPNMSRADYFAQARINLRHARRAVRAIERFLRKHGEPLTERR